MKVRPGLTADGGCWISDDRVYAFIGAGETLIGEIGYHGSQPVSRNSRILAGANGVVAVPGFRMREYDWLPGCVELIGDVPGGDLRLNITASGRRVMITGSCSPRAAFALVFRPDALFTDVHGDRRWESLERTEHGVAYRCRDRIFLDEWMKRKGPYAGDFMIPEPLRRTVFRRKCRSGFASRDDLLPEYVDAHLPVYDATVTVRIDGPAYELSDTEAVMSFRAPTGGPAGEIPPLTITFDDGGGGTTTPAALMAEAASVRSRHERMIASAPDLALEAHPHVRQFFSTVPALIDSAHVQDIGMPRATPGRYYWIWAWDAMVTATAALAWGETGLARRTSAFVDSHRDLDGRIPMRWTRDLQPLDTQDPGSLDALLYALAYAAYLETRDTSMLSALQPRMLDFLDGILARSDHRGCFANIGFYPDRPLRFHRTPDSAVAMEVAGFYTFCRICENVSRLLGDGPTASRAGATAGKIEGAFLGTFWDERKGFFLDAVDLPTGEKNESYPLFSLLFLHSPLGYPLVRGRIREAAEFIAHNHATRYGFRMLPAWDRNATSETAAGSWYPHWDLYTLPLLRRAGRSGEVVRWLRSVEETLSRLGYAPEFLLLDDLPDERAWSRHGAASNLNCVTGWYRALITGLCGLEQDPGGVTILPLDLPLDRVGLSGIRCHGTRWEMVADHGGPHLESLRVDGREITGCLKIPARYHDGGEHRIEAHYGTQKLPVAFSELTNAEVLGVETHPRGTEVKIRALGRVDLVVAGDHREGLRMDGAMFVDGPLADGSVIRLDIDGEHLLRV